MAKTQLNVRVDEGTARTARERALARGMSVNRCIEELVRQDAGEAGRAFVEAADFMQRYEDVSPRSSAPAPPARRRPGHGTTARTREKTAADPSNDLRIGLAWLLMLAGQRTPGDLRVTDRGSSSSPPRATGPRSSASPSTTTRTPGPPPCSSC